jgi:hypothetical protein
LATLKWVDWHSHQRLRIACHDLTPAKYELIHYSQHPARTELEPQQPESSDRRGGSPEAERQ